MLTALTAAPLVGQDLQQVADTLPVPTAIPAGTAKLEMPKVDGAEVKLLGADYYPIINRVGIVNALPSDVPVNVCFTVSKDGQTVTSRDYEITVQGTAKPEEGANAKPQVAPELLSWKGGKGTYRFGDTITVSKALPGKMQKELKAELAEVTGKNVSISNDSPTLRLVKEPKLGLGDEGYRLTIGADGVTIKAETDTALFRGTRSLLQMLRESPDLPLGEAVDMPRFRLRGFMLDCGRLPITLDFIRDLIRTMSWYKMNDLHLHLNDNYIFHEDYVDSNRDPFKESYSAFRLESKVKGKDGTKLTAQDLSYSKTQFRELIDFAKARGINIVPEFDAPGHALSFTRVRPDLIYQGPMNHKEKRRCEMLDASKPETVKFMGSVFDEYLKPQGSKKAVFDGCVVHIGADEFFGSAEDYRKFADAMLKFIRSRGYTPRLWGSMTIKKGNTPVLSEGVQMNLWSKDWADAWDSIRQGYDVINTNDRDLYVVPFSNYYRADFNQQRLYDNWLPNNVGGTVIPAGHPQLLGATYAIWNDMIDLKYRGYGAEDTWPSIVGMMELVSQKMWGEAALPMPFADYRALVHRIGDAPGTNIGYRKGVEKIDVDNPGADFGKPSVGPSYKATVKLILLSGKDAALFSGNGAVFYAADKDGNLAFKRADGVTISYNAKLPLKKECTLEIIATPGKTELMLDGQPIGHPSLPAFHNQDKDIVSSFILPLQVIGSPSAKHAKVKVLHLTVEPIDTPHTDCPQDLPGDQKQFVEGAVATPAPTE